MKENTSGTLKFFEFDTFKDLNVGVRFYTRHGGVSPSPWASLNQGGTVGDTRLNVIENRRRIFEDVARPVESIFDVWQVHGTNVICTTEPRELDGEHQKADGIFTDRQEVTLFMRFADCVPIILYEPEKRVIGIVHAGWQGTVDAVVSHSVRRIQEHYGIDPAKIIAGIGPSIGPDHYQIGPDVRIRVEKAFGDLGEGIISTYRKSIYLDLWTANEILLRQAGVKNIEVAEICTACHTEDWYSHRKENGSTGRFAAIAFLR